MRRILYHLSYLTIGFPVGWNIADTVHPRPAPFPAEIKHDDEFELHSFDDSSHVPRTWAYCFGEDAIYMSGDADGITSVGNSLNCDEGGILRG